MSYIIAIANEKGGVAKTTTAVSLGGAFAELGKRTLLLDLDPQANLTLALGHKPKQGEKSIANILLNSENPSNIIKSTSIENIDIIPSNSDLGLAERFLPVRRNHDQILQKSLKNESMPYEFILLDCPPALGSVSLNALTAADLLLIPTQAEYFSAYALKNMMTAIRQVRAQGNPHLIYRVLVTMYDKRNRTHQALLNQLNATFGTEGLLKSIVETDTKLRESPIVGVPIMYYMSDSRSADQYRGLAHEIINNIASQEQ